MSLLLSLGIFLKFLFLKVLKFLLKESGMNISQSTKKIRSLVNSEQELTNLE